MPRCSGIEFANGGYSISFAEHWQTAGETTVQWKMIIMNASTGDCRRLPPMPTSVPLCKNLKQKSCCSTAHGYNNFSPTITQRRGSRVNNQPYTTYCKCERGGTSDLLLHCGILYVLPRRQPGALAGPSPHT